MSNTAETRTERDSMGEMQVPTNAYYGASTQRAVLNFPISDLRFPANLIALSARLNRRPPGSTQHWAQSTPR